MSNKKRVKLPIIFITISLLAILGVTGLIFKDEIKTVTASLGLGVENQSKPTFAFNTSEFPDWATGGNVHTNPDDITDYGGKSKDSISITSLNVSQCKTGSNCNELVKKCIPSQGSNESCKQLEQSTTNTPCFVSAYYNKQIIDVNKARDDELKQWAKYGTEPSDVGVKTLTISTPEGDKNYSLYQYDTNNTDASYKRGSAFGFVPLNSGHIEIRSVCWEASQLNETLPVLSAIRLEN